jgi:hypothetical protein
MNPTKITNIIHGVTQILMGVAAVLGTLGYNSQSKPEMYISAALGTLSTLGGFFAHFLNSPAIPTTNAATPPTP